MRCFHVNSATAQAAMPMFCCHCVAFSPALGRSPNFSCHSTYFHERFALTIDKRRARSSCCETFLPLAPCFFFTATKSLHCSSCCGVALNFISSTAVPIFTDDFGQHPHHCPPAHYSGHRWRLRGEMTPACETPALQKVSVSNSRSDRFTQTCFHVVVALPGCVSMLSLPT